MILLYAVLYKNLGFDHINRINGMYMFNFTYRLVPNEEFWIDLFGTMFDWLVVYFPSGYRGFDYSLTLNGGRNLSSEAFHCHQIILMQILMV